MLVLNVLILTGLACVVSIAFYAGYKFGFSKETKMEKFTNTLIEQIDTLSHIANEFSNFAKMPPSVLQSMNVIVCLPAEDSGSLFVI